jgi:cysteine desulfurase
MEVYLDNSTSTKIDPIVSKHIFEFMNSLYGDSCSNHSKGKIILNQITNSRKIIASKIGAKTNEIIFTSGGTESNNLAILGTAFSYKNKGNHLITSKFEHPSVLKTFEYLETQGFKVDYIDIDSDGFIDLNQLKELISSNTILVSIMYANHEIGTIQNIELIGNICKNKNIIFHCDAVQSFTKIPIDVNEANISLLTISSHIIHGPTGIGALYIKSDIELNPILYGTSQELNIRPGTQNIYGIIGFSKAVEISNETDSKNMKRIRDYLYNKIKEKISGIQINGSLENRLPNNLNIYIPCIKNETLIKHLDMKNILISEPTYKYNSKNYILKSIGLSDQKSDSSITVVISKYTTIDEIDYFTEKLDMLVKKLRSI